MDSFFSKKNTLPHILFLDIIKTKISYFFKQKGSYFMKKLFFFFFSMAVLFGSVFALTSCSKEQTQPPAISEQEITDRTVKLDKCGLQYQAPEAWIAYEQTNMIPITNTTTEGDIYAQIQYNYVTDEGMQSLATLSNLSNTENILFPFGEIIVFKEENLNSETVQSEFSKYGYREEFAAQQGYLYYILEEYQGDISSLSEEEKKVYEILSESMEDLKATVSTYAFDETVVKEAIEQIKKTLSFSSQTLEGESIDSSIFANADFTVVNFWASYCYPNINETATLEQLDSTLKQSYPNVQFVQVVIDTPTTEAEEIAKQAKKEVNADFISIMPDETLGNWILQNLEGLPTTVIVNNQGQIITEQIQGVQSLENYIDAVETVLAE